MKYSHLIPLLVSLLKAFDEVGPGEGTQFQEECSGDGYLTAGVRLVGLIAARRDAARFLIFFQKILEILTQGSVWSRCQSSWWTRLHVCPSGCALAPCLLGLWSELRHLLPRSLYWSAPPCATWVWLSRASTGRTRTRPRGGFKWF